MALPQETTADVVLAEADDQIWLVQGEDHIGEVLNGTLPDGLTMQIVPVQDQAAAVALWWKINPQASDDRMPWAINPKLFQRVHGLADPGRRSIVFTPWSAMLGNEAHGAIAAMAGLGARLTLVQFELKSPAPGQADLQRLRLQLVRAALERAGATGIGERTDPVAAEGDTERMDILSVDRG